MTTTTPIERLALEKREAELLRLEHTVTRCLAEADTTAAALRGAIRSVCETEGWDCGRYFRVDEAAGVLRFDEAWGVPGEGIQTFIERSRPLTYAAGTALVGRVWQSAEPLWISDVTADPRPAGKAYSADTGIRSAFLFPVTSSGKTIGVLNFSSREIRKPDERLLLAVRVIGSQIGQFVQRKIAEDALRLRESRFRDLTRLSSDIYWEQDEEYRFTSFGGTGSEIVGAATLTWIGKKRWEQNYINMSDADWAAHVATLDARKPFRDLELCRLAEAGERVWISVSGEPVFSAAGVFVGYHGIGKEITARKRGERLLALEHAVTRALAEAESASSASQAVIRAFCESEGWHCGRYFGRNDKGDALVMSEFWHMPGTGLDRFIEESHGLSYPAGSGLIGRVWQSGRPLWVTDIGTDTRIHRGVARQAGLHGTFIFPVVSGGEAVGVFSFHSSRIREPDERLLEAVGVVGSQIGQYLQRKSAEEARRREEHRAALEHAVTRSLAEAESGLAGVKAALRIVCETEGWECGRYFAPDDEGGLLRFREGWGVQDEEIGNFIAMSRGLTYAPGVGLAGRVWQSGEPLWVADITGDTRVSTVGRAAESGIRGAFVFPLMSEGQRIGVLVFNSREVREPEQRLLQAIHVIGSQVGQFLQRKKADEKVRNQALQQRLIAEFGQQALASAEPNEVLTRAAELIAKTLHADFSNVLELAADRRSLVYRAATGWPQEWVGRRVVPVEPGRRLEKVLTLKEPLVIEDYAAEPGPASPLLEYGVHSGIQVPVFGPKEVFGVLSVHTREVRRFTEDDVSFLRSVANILAIAVERKSAEDRLTHLAQFDTVTGLPNRNLFRDRLGQALTQAQRNGWLGGMLFVDLDRFKAVNDTYGHGVGDRLLREVASRIKASVRAGDTVARLSGDEFAVVLSRLAKADDAGLVSQKIIDALVRVFELDGHQVYISASIGVAVYPSDGKDAEMLAKNADTAMYRAKEQGRSCYRFYLPEMNERLMERMRMESRLRGALDRGEYRLHYQPKVRLDTGVISGFEALLRWEDGSRLVPPLEFIPILEDTGLIVSVGEWVLRAACDQIGKWAGMGILPLPVAVNLSARQFQQKDLVKMVRQILKETRVAPDLLELELTETLLMSDAEEAVQMLRELKELGVRLSVDDFGTGYSSLAYLRRFTLDTLKIDRTFIRDVTSKPDDATLTLTIINLARSMRLKVVAEGVETEGQLSFLRLHGCEEIQGYFFARPMDSDDCTRVLLEDRRLQQPAPRPAGGLPAVLVVDDNEDDLELMTRALASDDYRILTATSAADGFEVLAIQGASVVISDFRMPGMSGIEFLTNVRKLYPDAVRIVAIGGDDPPTLTRAVNRAGIQKFLSKKWDAARLRAEVREAFSQQR